MHTVDTPQSKTKSILHAQQLMLICILTKLFIFLGGPRSILFVGGLHPLSCGLTCL